MRFLKIIFYTLILLIALAVAAVFLLPKDRLATLAANQLSNFLGREVQLSGDTTLSFYPAIGVNIKDLTVAAPEWAEHPDFITADGLSVKLDLMALLSGHIEISHIDIQSPTVRLITNTDGQTTWDLNTAPQENQKPVDVAPDHGPSQLSLDRLSLSNATVIYQEILTDQNFSIRQTDAEISLSAEGALALSISGKAHEEDFTLSVSTQHLFDLIEGKTHGVILNAGVGAARFEFNGDANIAGTVTGDLSIDVTDLNAILRAANQAPIDLPAGVREKIAFQGTIATDIDNEIFKANGALMIGPNTLTGPFSASLKNKHFFTANWVAQSLDLTPFTARSDTAEPAPNSAATGWSKAPIDVFALLHSLDADIKLTAGSVDLGDTQLGQTDIHTTLDNARLVIKMNKIEAFDGLVSGQFVVNGRNGMSVGGKLQAHNASLGSMLNSFAGFDKLNASGNTKVQFLASGPSLHSIMNTLSGDITLDVGAGELHGVDFANMFGRQSETGGGTTVFESIGASFTIKDGTMFNSDLAIAAPVFQATGEGQISLGNQSINFLVKPEVFLGESNGITVPVRIKGPWADLSIYPDLEYLAKQELAAREAELKAEAEARLREAEQRAREKLEQEAQRAEERFKQQAAEALHLEMQNAQSLEDAARDKVEEEINRGLGKLLGIQ